MDSLKTETIRIAKQGDVFITKTATKTLTNTQVVEKVIGFHFRDLIRALHIHNSVEITGFGKFVISPLKATLKLRQLEKIYRHLTAPDAKRKYAKSEETLARQIAGLERDIAYLRARTTTNETKLEGYYRRMEESLNSPSSPESIDRGDQPGEIRDLQGVSS